MRRLALVTLIAAGAAALAAPAQAQGRLGHGAYGYRGEAYGFHRAGYGRPGAGLAAGAAVAGFAIGSAVGAAAGGYGPGYDYVDAYAPALPSNDRYGYAWAPAAEAAYFSEPTGISYPVGPEDYSVTSGWYGY